MGAVHVNVDALHLFGVDIARHVVAFIHHQAGLALVHRLAGKHRAKQARTHDKIVVMLHNRSSVYSAPSPESTAGTVLRMMTRSVHRLRSRTYLASNAIHSSKLMLLRPLHCQ